MKGETCAKMNAEINDIRIENQIEEMAEFSHTTNIKGELMFAGQIKDLKAALPGYFREMTGKDNYHEKTPINVFFQMPENWNDSEENNFKRLCDDQKKNKRD